MIDLLIRDVIDTNVWISAFVNPWGAPVQLIDRARQGEFALVMSDYLIDEISEVCRRERVRRRLRIDVREIDVLLERFRVESIDVTLTGMIHLCRDPDDDAILETAIKGDAHFLVSRDNDLKRDLELIDHLASHGVGVISVAQLLEMLNARTA